VSDRDGVFARRWAARRTPDASPEDVAGPADEAVLSGAMSLLSDYEDAIYASCRHALVAGDASPATEAAHLVEAARLHGDVRRLRVEILSLLDPAAGGEA
jgi:hypothetical protein